MSENVLIISHGKAYLNGFYVNYLKCFLMEEIY
jgi:hypothetical protein